MENPSLSLKDTGRIYLDHNATTPPLRSVVENLPRWANQWGNPSSIHCSGRGPKALLRDSRAAVAKALNCHPLEIIFTSGGSESNNLVIKGFFESNVDPARNEYITSQIEHPSVMKSFEFLQERGAIVHCVPVDREGRFDLDVFKKYLSEKTALVSIMMANNETGSLMPIKKLVKLTHAMGAKFHTDGVQALGKIPVDLQALGVDYASFASHKVYALKGAGVVYAKKGARLKSLIAGGAQERSRRAGTENILSIAALGHVAGLLTREFIADKYQMGRLRDDMEEQIQKRITGVKVTGAGVARLPNTSSLLIEGIDGESLLMNLDIEGVSVSTGAACSSGSPEPSPVLLAMGLSRNEAQRSLRLSLGWDTTAEEIERFLTILTNVIDRLRTFRRESESTFIEMRESHV